MIIDEKGLVRAMKYAYKTAGYLVYNDGENVTIGDQGSWLARVAWPELPRKVLAMIVEHIGIIPPQGNAMRIQKDVAPQFLMGEAVAQLLEEWLPTEDDLQTTMDAVPLTFCGLQLFQENESNICRGVEKFPMGIVVPEIAVGGEITERGLMTWITDGEQITVATVRMNRPDIWEEWQLRVWRQLEGVDLHTRH